MLGAILSATDPVAVVALMKDLGVSKRLGTLLEGESLLNDGTSIVIFNVFFNALKERGEHRVHDDESDDDSGGSTSLNAAGIATYFLRLALGGPLLGVAVGIVTTVCLGLIYEDAHAEITLTVVAALGTFLIAETLTIQGQQLTSGVLAVVALGLMLGTRGRARVSTAVGHELHAVWAMLGFAANTVVFFISGLIVYDRMTRQRLWKNFGALAALYIGIHIARAVVLLVAWPTLQRTGYGLPPSHGVALWWGGLRGAVGLTLSLAVEEEPRIHKDVRDAVVFVVASEIGQCPLSLLRGNYIVRRGAHIGITVLTLLVNGTTMEFVLSKLGLSESSESAQLEFQSITAQISASTDRFVEQISVEDKFLADATWGIVFKYLPVHDRKTYVNRCRKMRDTHAQILTSRWRTYRQQFSQQAVRPRGMPNTKDTSLQSAKKLDAAYVKAQSVFKLPTGEASSNQARVVPVSGITNEEESKEPINDAGFAYHSHRLQMRTYSGIIPELRDEQLSEQRRRAVLMIKCALWHLLEEGYVRPSTMDSLLDAADVTLDKVTAGEPLACWTQQLMPILEHYSATLDLFSAFSEIEDNGDINTTNAMWRRIAQPGKQLGSMLASTGVSTRFFASSTFASQHDAEPAPSTKKQGWWHFFADMMIRAPVYRMWLRWKLAFMFEMASNYARTCAHVASDLAASKCDARVLHELDSEASLAEMWIEDNLERRFLAKMTRSLKTEIAARVALIFEQSTISELQKGGRLDERELAALRQPVTVSLKQLDFHPNAIEPPSALRQLLSIPAIADLGNEDDDALVRLANSAKEITLKRDEDAAVGGEIATAWYLVTDGTMFSDDALTQFVRTAVPARGATRGDDRRQRGSSSQRQFHRAFHATDDTCGHAKHKFYGRGEPIGLLDCIAARHRPSAISTYSATARLLKFDIADTLKIVRDRPLVVRALLAAAAAPHALYLPCLRDFTSADLRGLLSRGLPRIEPSKHAAAPGALAALSADSVVKMPVVVGCSHIFLLVGSCTKERIDAEKEKFLAPCCIPLDAQKGTPIASQDQSSLQAGSLVFARGAVSLFLRSADFDALSNLKRNRDVQARS